MNQECSKSLKMFHSSFANLSNYTPESPTCPLKRVHFKRKVLSSNHHFSSAFLVFGSVTKNIQSVSTTSFLHRFSQLQHISPNTKNTFCPTSEAFFFTTEVTRLLATLVLIQCSHIFHCELQGFQRLDS